LFRLPKNKVVGLVINPAQLQMIRTHRAEDWRMGETNYGDRDHIVRELAWTRKLFNDNGWHVIDVTDQAIEETSARVVGMLGLSQHPLTQGVT